jgi:hypothetical protein
MSAPQLIRSLFLVVAGGCAGPAPAAPEDSFRERLLATMPEDARAVVPAVFSIDGRQAAWVEQRQGACRAMSGERQGKPYGLVC